MNSPSTQSMNTCQHNIINSHTGNENLSVKHHEFTLYILCVGF